jgi:hypothetical protein
LKARLYSADQFGHVKPVSNENLKLAQHVLRKWLTGHA